MNEKQIVDHMIEFVEEKERLILTSKISATNQGKNDVVKIILDELERVTANENK